MNRGICLRARLHLKAAESGSGTFTNPRSTNDHNR